MPLQRRCEQNRGTLPVNELSSRHEFLKKLAFSAAATKNLSGTAENLPLRPNWSGSQARHRSPEWMVVVRVCGNILDTTKQWGAERGENTARHCCAPPEPMEPTVGEAERQATTFRVGWRPVTTGRAKVASICGWLPPGLGDVGAQGLSDGLVVWAPWQDGLPVVAVMRKNAGVPQIYGLEGPDRFPSHLGKIST